MANEINQTKKCPKCGKHVVLSDGKFVRHNPMSGKSIQDFGDICWGSGCVYLPGCPRMAYCPTMAVGPYAPKTEGFV